MTNDNPLSDFVLRHSFGFLVSTFGLITSSPPIADNAITNMPLFAYTARDSSGASITGTLAAPTVADVSKLLRTEGKYPLSINPANQSVDDSKAASSSGIKITRDEVIHLATQLSIMIETGVTLSDALDCIATQTTRPAMKRLVEDLSQQVQGGSDFSSALARHPRSFPRLFTALIKASEKSGMLSKLLNRATQYLRDEQETLRRVRGALIYPSVMLGFAVTTTIFLLVFVLPKFTAIYATKAATLPVPTQILIGLSSFLVNQWMLLLGGLIVTFVSFHYYFRTPGGTRVWYYTQLHLPLFGAIFRKLYLSRGLRMLGTMSAAGINLLDGVNTARDLTGNVYYQELWTSVAEQIEAGKQLSEPLFQNPLVPKSIAQMMSSAEKSGKLAFVMEQVAGFTEQELKETITEMTRYIEPAMISLMGLIIGGIAMALLLPIFTISRVMTAN